VLTDFGIARATDSATLTSDMLVGSPSYIAPERAWGGQAGPAADLWALGAALYAAVEGRAPFERTDALASLTAAVTDEPEPAIHAGPLWPVISGLLRKEPARRLGPAEAERMLRQAARDGEAPPRSPGAPDPGAPGSGLGGPQWRSRRVLGGLATVAMTAAAAAAFALPLSGSPGNPVGALAGPHPSALPSSGHASPATAITPSGGSVSPPRATSSPKVPPVALSNSVSRGRGAKDRKLPPGQVGFTDAAGLPASGPAPARQQRPHGQPGKQRHHAPPARARFPLPPPPPTSTPGSSSSTRKDRAPPWPTWARAATLVTWPPRGTSSGRCWRSSTAPVDPFPPPARPCPGPVAGNVLVLRLAATSAWLPPSGLGRAGHPGADLPSLSPGPGRWRRRGAGPWRRPRDRRP
jgi:serine/threonine protein kinase